MESALLAKGIAVLSYDKRGVTPKDASFLEKNIFDPAVFATATAKNLLMDARRAYEILKGVRKLMPLGWEYLDTVKEPCSRPRSRRGIREYVRFFLLGLVTRLIRRRPLLSGSRSANALVLPHGRK